MHEHILRIALPELQAAQQLHDFRRDALNTQVGQGLSSGFQHDPVEFRTDFGGNFLDPRRLNAPVSDKLFQRLPRNLATYRIET